jgi:hypothetical protein
MMHAYMVFDMLRDQVTFTFIPSRSFMHALWRWSSQVK